MLLPALLLSTVALADQVKVEAWSASSTAAAAATRDFEASHLSDNKQAGVWVEGDSGAGMGAWVQADFGAAKTITSLVVWGGDWSDAEAYSHFNRPKTIVAEYADGSTEEFTTEDKQVPQVLRLKSAKTTQTVKLRVKGFHPAKGVDTAMTEVRFFDDESTGAADVLSATSSSQAAEDADGIYSAMQAADGMGDSMWCEGNAKSDGSGEWIQVTFARATTISSMKVRNGAATADVNGKVNRATSATLTFSDGATQTVEIKDTRLPTTIALSPHQTSSVKLTFSGVVKGTEFNDICVTDVTFSK